MDEFRRFIPKVGSSGRGIVQFWGVRATRKNKEPWKVSPEGTSITVEVSDISAIREPK